MLNYGVPTFGVFFLENVYLGFSFLNVSLASTSMDKENNMKKV